MATIGRATTAEAGGTTAPSRVATRIAMTTSMTTSLMQSSFGIDDDD